MSLEEYKGVYVFAQQVDNHITEITYELMVKLLNLQRILIQRLQQFFVVQKQRTRYFTLRSTEQIRLSLQMIRSLKSIEQSHMLMHFQRSSRSISLMYSLSVLQQSAVILHLVYVLVYIQDLQQIVHHLKSVISLLHQFLVKRMSRSIISFS